MAGGDAHEQRRDHGQLAAGVGLAAVQVRAVGKGVEPANRRVGLAHPHHHPLDDLGEPGRIGLPALSGHGQ